jgi:hypothetical protein
MGQDLGDHGGIFDGSEDRQGPTALRTLLDVDIEHPLEQLGPTDAGECRGRECLTVVGYIPVGRMSPGRHGLLLFSGRGIEVEDAGLLLQRPLRSRRFRASAALQT